VVIDPLSRPRPGSIEGGTMTDFPRFKLVPGWIDVDVSGWELTGDRVTGEQITECHDLFHIDNEDADVQAAQSWADGIIGTKQVWTHVRERGFDRWEAGTTEDQSAEDGDREPTPADLRALVADAAALQERIRDVEERLRASEETRQNTFRLDHAAGQLDQISRALHETASELARIRAVRDGSVCTVPWGVCPEHGNTLTSSGGRTRCTRCIRVWNYDRLGVPCGEPLTHQVTDAAGSSFRSCQGHAMDATERLTGATVTPLDSTEA
jgi:hypothetical protein